MSKGKGEMSVTSCLEGSYSPTSPPLPSHVVFVAAEGWCWKHKVGKDETRMVIK